MQNVHDENEAGKIIESACPNPAVRRMALSIFGEAIQEVNLYGRDKWALRVEETLRLTVKHYYVCTLWTGGVWLALDNRLDFPPNDYYPTRQQLQTWGWVQDHTGQPGAYPSYKDASLRADFSVNGFYTIDAHHAEIWPHIRRLFFDFLYKAIYHGQPMDPRTPALHSSGAVKYLRNNPGMNLPDPLY